MPILYLDAVKAGETPVVAGAAGGVASAVVQPVRYRGVTVIGRASQAKHNYLHALGAVPVTYGPSLAIGFEPPPQDVDAALDLAGAGVVPDLVAIAGDGAHVPSMADIDAPEHGAQVTTLQVDHPEIALAEVGPHLSQTRVGRPHRRQFPAQPDRRGAGERHYGHVAGKRVIIVLRCLAGTHTQTSLKPSSQVER